MFQAIFYNVSGEAIDQIITDDWQTVQTTAAVIGAVRVEVAIAYA